MVQPPTRTTPDFGQLFCLDPRLPSGTNATNKEVGVVVDFFSGLVLGTKESLLLLLLLVGIVGKKTYIGSTRQLPSNLLALNITRYTEW